MSDKVQLIKEEIEKEMRVLDLTNDFDNGRFSELNHLKLFIKSLPEEHNEDLEEEIERYLDRNFYEGDDGGMCGDFEPQLGGVKYHELAEIARHFAEWQKQKDEKLFKEDTWNYIEEQYPNITKEEKLRLYNISLKSRLAGAKTQKNLDQETIELAEEHAMLAGMEKIREEMMKNAVEAKVICVGSHEEKDSINAAIYSVCEKVPVAKFGDKVKIIIVKEE